MTTQKTAIEARKIVDELAEIQKRPMQYAKSDEADWMINNLERLQKLMEYLVDDLSQDDGYGQLELASDHTVKEVA
jgi:ribosomal protein L17